MDQDKVMRLESKAGFATGHMSNGEGLPVFPFIAPHGNGCIVELEKFAALVAEAEREACAEVCDSIPIRFGNDGISRLEVKNAIRARNKGEQGQ